MSLAKYLVALMALILAACGSSGAEGPDGGVVDAAGADASSGPCDPVHQAGCGPGRKCSVIPTTTDGTQGRLGCVPDTGDKLLMEACTAATSDVPDDCRAGLYCRGAQAPVCVEFCASEPADTCSAGQQCGIDVDLDGDRLGDLELCAEQCRVLEQDCTVEAYGCYPSRQGALCAPEGAGEPARAEGETCTYANSCEEGLGCFLIGFATEWQCFQLCDPQLSTPGCSAGKLCNPVENREWGICVAPL